MDKRKAFFNISVSIVFKIIILIASFINRRMVILFLGNDINGINSLYSSIIGILSIAELGIGGAITFSMYKPIVEKNEETITALYRLYKKIYGIIGLIVLVIGILLIPFLRFFIKDYSGTSINLQLTFLIFLLSTVITYFYGADSSLINAYKDNYIVSVAESICNLLMYLMQILVLNIYQSFEAYLLCGIISAITLKIVFSCIVSRRYRLLHGGKYTIDGDSKNEIVKNTRALFISNIGSMLVNTIDSVIISTFVGITVLGKYSNYTVIVSAVSSIISLIFTSLRSVVGHLMVKESIEKIESYFDFFHMVNYEIGLLFCLGYYAIIDDLIQLCFGTGLLLNKSISFVISLNFFIQYFRQANSLFRTASGVYYPDRWRPFFEGLTNLLLSIALVKILPTELAVVGVIVATIITNLFIYNTTAPYVLYKYVFRKSCFLHVVKHFLLICLYVVAMVVLNALMILHINKLIELFINGLISVMVTIVVTDVVLVADKSYRKNIIHYLKRIMNMHKSNNSDV